MPTETLVAMAIVTVTIVVVIVSLLALSREEQCPHCKARVPPEAIYCPACRHLLRSPGQGAAAQQDIQPAHSPELIAIQGPLAQQRFPIPLRGLAIGRHPDNDLVLTDELMASRRHAAIALEGDQYVLYDRDSANGTWVNDQRIFRHILAAGDRVQIGQSYFVFAAPGAPRPPPVLPSARPPVMHVVGESFDDYFLEGMIGQGGMSDVFKARAPNGQTVAVKILKETNPYLVTKFIQEGNKIGPLLRAHPHIVYVYGFYQSRDGRLYIVMEYVDGSSLRRVVGRRLPEAEVVRILGQACSALAFAHHNGIVHRDIKPENILLTANGTVKVLDFGIAKLTSATTVTRDQIVGTPEYISPEQARGDPVQPASDVYSMGIVLYEILTGSVPFRRPHLANPRKAIMAVLNQHLKERPEPIRQRNPQIQVSAHLEQVTMRTLEKDIKARYPTAREMGQALGYRERNPAPFLPVKPTRASLVILQGTRRGRRIPLAGRSLALGRSDLDPLDRAISRHHVDIIFRGDGYWLQDTSRNGTWVDGRWVGGEIPLRTGAEIMIGNSVLRFEKE